MKRWLMAAFLAALQALPVLSCASEISDLERGHALYENHCQVCHTANVHSRPNRIPLNVDELRQIVTQWSVQENLRWSAEDVEDVVYYLQRTRYRF